MHEFASYNFRFCPVAEIRLPAVSVHALYGKGVFTTLAVHDKKPFLWKKHWRRLSENAAKIGIDLSGFAEAKIKNALTELVEQNRAARARARITFFDESPSKVWAFDSENKISLLIQTGDLGQPKENLSLTVSPFSINSTSPLAGVKSCNYLENIFALENAKTKGFDEAIRLNERGEIVSACMANIFWLKDEKLFTPSLKTGCLAGTTREFFMEKRRVFEVEENLEVLNKADKIYLTSSGMGVAEITNYKR